MVERDIKNILTDPAARGVFTEMPRGTYDECQRLNASSICSGLIDHEEIDPSAIKFAFEIKMSNRIQSSQDRLDRGTLAHLLLLQPDRVETDVAVWYGDRRYGGQWEEFVNNNPGKLIVTERDWESVGTACQAFRFERALTSLLTDIDAEVAVLSEEFGAMKTKGLIDAVRRDIGFIIDLKTTEQQLTKRSVQRLIRDFHNREKGAAYKRWYERESGREIEAVINIFLCMIPPYSIRIVRMSDEALEWGEQRIVDAMTSVSNCLTDNRWPIFCASDQMDVAPFEGGEQPDEVEWGT